MKLIRQMKIIEFDKLQTHFARSHMMIIIGGNKKYQKNSLQRSLVSTKFRKYQKHFIQFLWVPSWVPYFVPFTDLRVTVSTYTKP